MLSSETYIFQFLKMLVLIKEVIMAYVVYINDTIKNADNETVSAISQQWSGIRHATYADAEAELAAARTQRPDATIEEV